MPEFTITEVADHTRDWDDKHKNKNRSYYVQLDGFDKGQVEIAQRADKAAPSVGEKVSGEITERQHDGKTYYKLKKDYGGGSGGSGGASQGKPDESYWAGQNAAKGRSAAQDRAVRAWGLGFRPPTLVATDAPMTVENLALLIDWFDEDVKAATRAAVEEASSPAAATRSAASQPASTAAGGTSGSGGNGGSPPERDGKATRAQVQLMDLRRKKAGVTDAELPAMLAAFDIGDLAEIPKDRVDDFLKAVGDPIPTGESEVPVDHPDDEKALASTGDDGDIPF